jgi:hypothetical protein
LKEKTTLLPGGLFVFAESPISAAVIFEQVSAKRILRANGTICARLRINYQVDV